VFGIDVVSVDDDSLGGTFGNATATDAGEVIDLSHFRNFVPTRRPT
jgi:hypothetical protein